MGWLCSKCGTENRFREARCCACLSKGSLKQRAVGLGITLYERCGANHLGGFSESTCEKVERGIRSVNRVSAAGICAAAGCGLLIALFMCSNAVRTGLLEERLLHLGANVTELMEAFAARAAGRAQELTGIDWSRMQTWDVIENRLLELTQRGQALAGGFAEMVRAVITGFVQRVALIAEELPRMDIHIVSWLINRLYELYRFMMGLDVQWIREAAGGLLTVCEWLSELIGRLWELRA